MEKTVSKQEKLLISRLEKHPEFVQAIGMISIENANLEAQMARLFSRALFIPMHVGFAIYLTPKSAIARLENISERNQGRATPERIGGTSEKTKGRSRQSKQSCQ